MENGGEAFAGKAGKLEEGEGVENCGCLEGGGTSIREEEGGRVRFRGDEIAERLGTEDWDI